MINDMGTRGRDLFPTHVKRSGRSSLADLRRALKIFAWFAPVNLRDGCHPSHDEIAIEKRMGNWRLDLSALRGALEPDLEMTNIFSQELERGRIARPPYTPYVVAESLAIPPWMPTDDAHNRALEKWRVNQKTYHRHTGSQDLSFGQYVLYRLRFILAGDLADAWGDFGGLVGQLNQLAIVIEMSITDHAGIAITYDHRIHREIRKIVSKRSSNTDYIDFLSNINSDIKTGVIRDFEAQADAVKNEKERERITKEKEKKAAGKGEKGAPKEKPAWTGRKWTKADWTAWRAKTDSDTKGAKPDNKTTESPKKKEEKAEKKKTDKVK